MLRHLFLASTPFNILTSSMMAFSLPYEDEKTLWLIDQPETETEFVTAIRQWSSSPFSKIHLISTKARGRKKAPQRKKSLNKIDELLANLAPDKVYTGNDRRIEFQYVISRIGLSSSGVYLDDGTYTYLGRQTHWLKDHLIDHLIKKITYGCWWDQPSTIGASRWIKDVYAAFPEFVHPQLKAKKVHQLPLNLNREEFGQLSSLCLSDSDLQTKIGETSGLILLPHCSVINLKSLAEISEWANGIEGLITFKHHPRSVDKTQFDSYIPKGAIELPATIPMEVMLPLLPDCCLVSGDISTALLTSKWLRPNLTVSAIGEIPQEQAWLNLLTALDIKTS